MHHFINYAYLEMHSFGNKNEIQGIPKTNEMPYCLYISKEKSNLFLDELKLFEFLAKCTRQGET